MKELEHTLEKVRKELLGSKLNKQNKEEKEALQIQTVEEKVENQRREQQTEDASTKKQEIQDRINENGKYEDDEL